MKAGDTYGRATILSPGSWKHLNSTTVVISTEKKSSLTWLTNLKWFLDLRLSWETGPFFFFFFFFSLLSLFVFGSACITSQWQATSCDRGQWPPQVKLPAGLDLAVLQLFLHTAREYEAHQLQEKRKSVKDLFLKATHLTYSIKNTV